MHQIHYLATTFPSCCGQDRIWGIAESGVVPESVNCDSAGALVRAGFALGSLLSLVSYTVCGEIV